MKIDIRITSARLNQYVTLDQIIGLQEGNLKAIRSVVPIFMWNEAANDYYPVTVTESEEEIIITPDPKASKMIGGLPIERIKQLSLEFREKADLASGTSPTNADGSSNSTLQG